MKLLQPLVYILGAYFLGGFIVLCGGALSELVDKNSNWFRVAAIYLGVGGITWYLFHIVTNSDNDDV